MIEDLLGKLVADKYRIESLIRESEMGDLFVGKHEVLDKPVTVKILARALAVDARWVKRFVDEARTASAVSHPNILNITDFGTDARGISYAIFEPADGGTLRDIIASEASIDEKRALTITRQIAVAVAAAHAKKIIHGSLAPQNIFLNKDGESETVKVYGFGADPLAVSRDANPSYLSPEQCTSFPAADERSDIYSLGIMLYELLTGVVPYDGLTVADVLAKQNSEPPAPLSAFRRDLHPDLEPIMLSAMAADPERRYQSMTAFAEDLALLSGGIIAPPKTAAAAADAPKRNIWQTAFIVLFGISLLAIALIYATSVKKTDPTANLQAEAGFLPVQPIGPATGAQEESLAKLPAMTDAEIIAASNTATGQTPDMVPGGDGYNAWANGGVPPPGAPLNNQQNVPPVGYVPPGGQYYTVDGSGSQFMPPDSGVILVPVPVNANTSAKPSPTPKNPAANANTQTGTVPGPTPKPMATPVNKVDKPVTTTPPAKDKPVGPAPKAAKTPGKPADPQ